MYVVLARLLARSGEEATIIEAMREIVPASRAEPGCLVYVAHQDESDPRRFMFYEQYVDEAAYQAHVESEHYRRLVPGKIAPAVEERERSIYREVI
jgi:autoinducer 2-degrading protein